MKSIYFKLLCLLVLVNLVIMCNNEAIQEKKSTSYSLDENGDIFIKCLKTNSNWKMLWQEVSNRGTPLINNAIISYTPQYNIHYLLPILSSDNIIKEFALFPMEEMKVKTEVNATLKEPVFFSSNDNSGRIQNVITSDIVQILLNVGFTLDKSFMFSETNLDSRVMTFESRTYKIRYRRNGASVSPWTEDREFLIQLLRECEKAVQNWQGEYQVIIYEYEIIIKFMHYNSTSVSTLDSHVVRFLSNITFSLKEVIVMPSNTSFTVTDSYTTEPQGQLTGILIKAGTLVPLRHHLYNTGTPNPPSFLEPEDICSNLKFKLEIESLKDKLKILRNSLNEKYEIGIGFRYTANGELEFDTQKGSTDSAFVDYHAKYPLNGFIHSHYVGTLPYFSYDDLFTPYLWYKQGKISNLKTFSFGVVGTAGTIFLYFDPSKYLAWAQKNYHANSWDSSVYGYSISYSVGLIQGGIVAARERLAKYLFKDGAGIYVLDVDLNTNVRRYEIINSDEDTNAKKCKD